MSHLSQRVRVPRVLLLGLTAVLALTVAGSASAEFPTKRSDPSVHGIPQEGQTLNGQTGQWLMDNGLRCDDCTFTYYWQRCNADGSGCSNVTGRTGFTYLLGPDDVDKKVRFVEEVFKRDCGAHNSQTGEIECHDITKNGVSVPFGPITAKPITTPQNTTLPTIRGVPMEDEVLRASSGTWSGPGTITQVIYWQRCNLSGEGCATVFGATGSTYRLTSEDVDTRIRVIETATNEGGTVQAVSATTAPVVELKPTAARPTVAITKVKLPHRLVLSRVVTKQSGKTVTVLVRVSDDRGFRVSGAEVRVTPTALLVGSAAPRISSANGWATFRYQATGTGTALLYVEARRRGEQPQSGISTANLFRILVG